MGKDMRMFQPMAYKRELYEIEEELEEESEEVNNLKEEEDE